MSARNATSFARTLLQSYRSTCSQGAKSNTFLYAATAAAAALTAPTAITTAASPDQPTSPPAPLQATPISAQDLPHLVAASSSPSNEATAQWRVFTDVARDLVRQGRADEAENTLKKALDAARRGFGAEDPHVASACQNLAELYRLQRRYDEAGPLYDSALKILANEYGNKDIRLAFALHNTAGFYFAQGQLDRASELYEQSLQVKLAAVGPGHGETANSLFHLAEVRWAQGRREEAVTLASKSLDVLEQQGMSDAGCTRRRTRLAEMLMAVGKAVQAEPLLRKVLDGVDSLDDAGRAAAVENIAAALKDQGKLQESKEQLEYAVELRRKRVKESTVGVHGVALASSLRRLADVCVGLVVAADVGSNVAASTSESIAQACKVADEAVQIAESVLRGAITAASSSSSSSLRQSQEANNSSSSDQQQSWFSWLTESSIWPFRNSTQNDTFLALRQRSVRPETATLELAACWRTQSAAKHASGDTTAAVAVLQKALHLLQNNWPLDIVSEADTDTDEEDKVKQVQKQESKAVIRLNAMRRDLICQIAASLLDIQVLGKVDSNSNDDNVVTLANQALKQHGCENIQKTYTKQRNQTQS